MAELAVDHISLFSDVQQLVMKANEDLVALIKVRISEHQKAEAQRERIRLEELKRIDDEAKAKTSVEPAPVASPTPVRTAAPVQSVAKPTATVAAPVNLQAEEFDLEALIKAVTDAIERYYLELRNSANPPHLVASGWIAIPDEVSMDEAEAAKLFYAAGAWHQVKVAA